MMKTFFLSRNKFHTNDKVYQAFFLPIWKQKPMLNYKTLTSYYSTSQSSNMWQHHHRIIMVNVLKGVLIECDPTVKQFLLHMDEKELLGRKFVIEDLDASHLFVSPDVVRTLEEKLWELMDKLSFPLGDGQWMLFMLWWSKHKGFVCINFLFLE